ncbi:ribosome assembly factor SBDS [Candidatus Micrarchaeota archaeon]|nr:ribosome assembly factor SBDS [Candidatus Micrarchaeota archaeon]
MAATLDNAIIAHLDLHGEHFEILVEPKNGYDFKVGKRKDLTNVLVVEEVFKDARKGDRHKEDALKKAFGTVDVFEVAKQIFARGEIQLTTDQKRQMLEEKRKKIVAILARECVDPRTGAPHPPQRIEKAMEEARVHVDMFKDAESQLEEVLKSLRLLLPLKFEKARVAIRIPAEFASKSYGALKEYNMQQEEWQKDGSFIAVVEMPAGVQAEFYDKVNKLTGGRVETKLLKK